MKHDNVKLGRVSNVAQHSHAYDCMYVDGAEGYVWRSSMTSQEVGAGDISREVSTDVPSSPEESATSGLGAQREGHTTTLKNTGHNDGICNPIQRGAGASSEHLESVSTLITKIAERHGIDMRGR